MLGPHILHHFIVCWVHGMTLLIGLLWTRVPPAAPPGPWCVPSYVQWMHRSNHSDPTDPVANSRRAPLSSNTMLSMRHDWHYWHA